LLKLINDWVGNEKKGFLRVVWVDVSNCKIKNYYEIKRNNKKNRGEGFLSLLGSESVYYSLLGLAQTNPKTLETKPLNLLSSHLKSYNL